jgi:phage shock protein A
MTLRLFDRLAMVIKADAHGVVESLEERSLLLKQYLREAEIELHQKAARLDAVREEGKRLRDELARREDELRSLDEDIDLALAGDKDDLARFAVRRLLPRRGEAQALRTRIEERSAEESALLERVEIQRQQLETLRARVRSELARESQTSAPRPWPREAAVADEEVELELLRRRRGGDGERP